jgi:hypothetical protein
MLLSSCNDPRRGALSPETRTALESYVLKNTDVQKKYLVMTDKVAQLLGEAAGKSDAVAIGMITKFTSDNQFALNLVAEDFDGWQRHVEHAELIEFVILLNAQPYTRRLRELVPAFRRRFSGNDQHLRQFDELMWYFEIRK